jgi:large subunit ribosomal protein L29
MKTKELRSKEDKELRFDLKNLNKELFDLRFQSASENLSNPARIKQIKREVARIMTILNERRKETGGEAPE